MPDIAALRFLEIGPPYVKTVFPEQTLCFSTWPDQIAPEPARGLYNVSLRTLGQLCCELRRPGLSLIICRPSFFSPWHWNWISRVLFDRRILAGNFAFMKAVGPQLLRLPVAAPIAIADTEDVPFINRNHFFLLSRCEFFFKRELPPDRWRLFMKTAHPNLPSPRFRRGARYRDWIDKVRPLSLGLPLTAREHLPIMEETKITDIFFAGEVEKSSTVRKAGLREILALRDRGITVDIPEGRLPPDEFYRRCARAWLTWSPEGLGWDCFRHYEALACGSVPVINQPTIERYRPLRRDAHAFYYDPEPGELTRVMVAALTDKPRLQVMARDGSAHVLAHHTPKAIVSYMIKTTLGLANDSAGLQN